MCKCVTESRRFSLPKQSTWPCRAHVPQNAFAAPSHMPHRYDIFDNPRQSEPTAQRHAWISVLLNAPSREYLSPREKSRRREIQPWTCCRSGRISLSGFSRRTLRRSPQTISSSFFPFAVFRQNFICRSYSAIAGSTDFNDELRNFETREEATHVDLKENRGRERETKCCRGRFKKKKDSPAFVCIGLTREGQIYGQYPLRKIRADKGGVNARARKCVSGTHTEYRDWYHRKSRCNTSTSISADRCTLVTLSSRICFPRACYRRALGLPRYTLVTFNFPRFFREKKARCFNPRNTIAPLHVKQNEETAGETERPFSSSRDKRKGRVAFYFSALLRRLFSLFPFLLSRTKFAISRRTETFYAVELKASVKNNGIAYRKYYVR